MAERKKGYLFSHILKSKILKEPLWILVSFVLRIQTILSLILLFCKRRDTRDTRDTTRKGYGIHPVGKDKVRGLWASKAVIISLKEMSGGSVTNICIHL